MLMMRCALCGRRMADAAVLIGALPVGPKCAVRAGLLDRARRGLGALRLGGKVVRQPRQADTTLDLFAQGPHG